MCAEEQTGEVIFLNIFALAVLNLSVLLIISMCACLAVGNGKCQGCFSRHVPSSGENEL